MYKLEFCCDVNCIGRKEDSSSRVNGRSSCSQMLIMVYSGEVCSVNHSTDPESTMVYCGIYFFSYLQFRNDTTRNCDCAPSAYMMKCTRMEPAGD
ncbi:hypothetical protein R5R35_012191 [Gryllus longicercus]|uniref:Uncharacterized protein n=1 Tax=Gryllus longicercus TaxID=2509291 RepID=A0AAN9VW61_9ORTH